MFNNTKYNKQLIAILALICQLFLPAFSSADSGSCARFHLNISLNDDTQVYFIQLNDYDDNMENWNEQKIFEDMKRSARNNKLIAYKKIQTINYPEGNKHYNYKYVAVANKDKIVLDININKISSIKKIGVSPCEHGDFEDALRYKVHYTTQIIEGLSQEDIDLLQTRPVYKIEVKMGESYEVDVCLNYNESIDENELQNLCTQSNLYLNPDGIPYEEYRKKKEEYNKKAVEALRNKGVIVIHLYGGC